MFRRYWGKGRFKRSYGSKFATKHSYGRPPKGAEAKAYDIYDGQSVSFGAANVIQPLVLNAVTEGTSYKTRLGARVKLKSIDLHIWPYFGGAGANYAAGEVNRIMLVYDSQANGAYPASADLLKATGGSTLATSPVNLENRDRFLILREYYFTNPTAAAGSGAALNNAAVNARVPEHCIHWYVKLKNMETIFKATAGAIGDIASGALLLVTVSESITPPFGLSVTSRLRFYD